MENDPTSLHALAAVYRGPLAVTTAYVLLYYVLILNGLRVRTRLKREYAARGEPFDRYFGNDRQMLAADRIMLNTLEQMPPFLCLFWLNAVFVGPLSATIAGGIYVLSRSVYPLLLGRELGRGVSARVTPATYTGYTVIVYLAASCVWASFA